MKYKNKILSKLKALEKHNKKVIPIFFLLFLLMGLGIFDDYGLSWDEPRQREIGEKSYSYIFKGDKSLLKFADREYGVAFGLPLVVAEKLLELNDSRSIFLMRHLLTFLLFYLSAIFFYLLCEYYLKSWKLGLLGVLFLILSPQIFANSFYNSKDLAFLSVFIICIYTLIRFLDKKTLHTAVVHAAVCAVLVDIRITGVIVPFLTFLFVAFDLFRRRFILPEIKKSALNLSVYTAALILLVILFWPWLWNDPIHNFIQAFNNFSAFKWGGTVLYMGRYIKAYNLPWHYIPVWMLITTPLIYSFNFFIGIFDSIKSLFKGSIPHLNNQKRDNLIVLLWFFMPLIAVILFKSTMYDGWRHIYFIYPAFLIISLKGLLFLFHFVNSKLTAHFYRIVKIVLITIITICLFSTAFLMIKSHPHQNAYFNKLAGNNTRNNFELDYWGLSYRQALEFILESDSRDAITVSVENFPGQLNSKVLPKDSRDRLDYTGKINESDYFLANFRWHPNGYPYHEFYSINVNGNKIMAVYKIKTASD